MFLITLLVILEILKIPHAQEKVESFSFSFLKHPLVSSSISSSSNSAIKLSSENLSSIPIKKKNAKEPYLNASGSIVIDIPSSTILYSKNANQKFPIASLTKIMTAIIALENYNLDDILSVPAEAPQVAGSRIYLKSGEQIRVENLLYGLLLYSGNDAAHTLAANIGRDAFVSKMNSRARELGLETVSYADESGLNQQNSASLRDLALLAAYALKNPQFAKIVKTEETTIFSADGQIAHPLKNTNRLLRDFPGTFGIKTGFTNEAGHCLVVAAQREDVKILSVVVDSPSDQFKESEKILEWVFSNYIWYKF